MNRRLITMKVDPKFNQWLKINAARHNMNLIEFGRHLTRGKQTNIDMDINIDFEGKNEKNKGKKEKFFW